MPSTTRDRLRGTLDILILRTLTWGPRHGYAIGRWLEETAGPGLTIEEGSLYPSLYRMEQRHWISSEWGRSELGREAKFYKLTAAGRKQLKAETAEWQAFIAMISRVLVPE
ncbi:MAG TPA: PadR family transcriptional regulator [Gemmatimonadales bacterium]|jgi:transcriptional regulator